MLQGPTYSSCLGGPFPCENHLLGKTHTVSGVTQAGQKL